MDKYLVEGIEGNDQIVSVIVNAKNKEVAELTGRAWLMLNEGYRGLVIVKKLSEIGEINT